MLRRTGPIIEMGFEVEPLRGVLKLYFDPMTEEDDLRKLLEGEIVSFSGGYTAMIKDGELQLAGPKIAFSAVCNVEAMKKALGPVEEN